MDFPSCIKIPASKNNNAPENAEDSGVVKDFVNYERLLSIANSIFGEGRWSHAITSQTIDYVEYILGKYHVGCAAFVKVQLPDGTFHEDMGYSTAESSVRGSAIKSARYSSIALGLKKALLCFGGIMKEKISNDLTRIRKDNGENLKAREGKLTDSAMVAALQTAQKICAKDAEAAETIVCAEEEKSGPGISSEKAIKISSEPKRSKSPKLDVADGGAIAKENDVAKPNNGRIADNLPSASLSEEEEIRLERKRKQKQKQEEFKKLMKEKLLKNEEKPHPRF